MNQSWILQVRLAFVTGMRPDTRPMSHYGRRWYLDSAEKRQRSGHINQVANPISMRLTFSLRLSFTSGTASLSHCMSLSQSVKSLLWTECLVLMAFVCVQLKTNSFPSCITL